MFVPFRIALLLAALLATAVAEEEKAGDAKSDAGTDPAEIARQTQERARNRTLYFRGEHVFDRQCVHCHGTTGRGNGPWAGPMETKPRNLRSGIFKFRTTPSEIYRTIATGLDGTPMIGYHGSLKPDQIWDLVEFIRSLRSDAVKKD